MESSLSILRNRRPLSLKKNILRTGLLVNIAQGFMMNVFINACIGMGLFLVNGFRPIPLFGPISISGDLISMSATLTFLVCWFNIKTARAEIKHFPQKQINRPAFLVRYLCVLIPTNRLIRVLLLSILFTLLCLPVIEALHFHGKTVMSGFEFILFKSLYSGVLAAGVIWVSSYSVYLKKS